MNNITEFFKKATLSNNFLCLRSIILHFFIFGAIFIAPPISVSTADQLGAVWHRYPGWARDIAVLDSNHQYVVGTDPAPGGYGIHKWHWPKWKKINGGAVRIAIGGSDFPWIVNSDNMIFQWFNGKWQRKPGWARDIGVGRFSVWVIGTDPAPGGYGIFKWNQSTGKWNRFNGGAVRIAADYHGHPWIVNSDNKIFRWSVGFDNKGRWEQLPGSARDIAIGGHWGSTVWVIGTDPTDGGYGIHRWNGINWDKIDGGAVQISVGSGLPWIVDSKGAIFQCQGVFSK